ncbi:MAG: TonB-dependent receptor [Chitinophagaceae bacterium]|nr:TonB-dependent receptor [Chitinophagaceae bacterium]
MILLMKCSLFLVFATVLQVAAKEVSSQETLTVHFNNVKLSKALKEIERKTDYRFVFSTMVMKDEFKVTISERDITVNDLLRKILAGTGLVSNQMSEKLVIIKSVEANTESAVAAPPVKGRIVNNNGEPLAGVTIRSGKNITVSDTDGNFSIEVESGGSIEASYVGYATQTIKAGAQTSIDIVMQAVENKLDEIVVVGYSTQSRRKLTSAVATISGDEINKRVATNPAALLQGQLPGLQVIQGSGEPGNENVNMRIRGVSTFSGAGNDPLVIVDGLPGSLTVLNPNDIESISVLKDAASAAIYGSRGANGVIVVKTKKGKSGGFSLTYNYNLGLSRATSLPDMIYNSAEYMELTNEARSNSGLQPIYTQEQIDLYKNATDRTKYPNHNWLDDQFVTANVQNHYLNLNGGKDNTNYNLGIGYTDQPGTMIGFQYKKYTLDLGLQSKVHKRITIGTNIQMRYGDKKNPRQGATDQFLSTLAQSPLYAPVSPDGSKYIFKAYPLEQGNKNTVAIVQNDVRTRTDDYYIQGNLSLDVEILKGLVWENRGGANYSTVKTNDFRPIIPLYWWHDLSYATNLDVGSPGLDVGRNDNIYTVYYSQLNFRRTFGDHTVSALAGFQQEHNKYSFLNAGRVQYTTNLLREINAGPTSGMYNSGSSNEWAIRSYYGNLNYDFQDKYLVGASLRYDGTSRLPKDTRWGLFYSFSGAWRISEENFMRSITWIDDLKIRGSWGELGNQNIGNYPYQPVLQSRDYVFGTTITPGYAASGLVDPNLTWETTRVFDIGVDMTLLQNKLNITADWFNKYTFDILRQSQVPLWLGLNAPTINNGAVRNKGFEVSAQYRDKIAGEVGFTVGANVQAYKNKLEQFGAREISGNTIREEGRALDEFYVYIWDGIFQSQDEIDKSPKQPVTPTPGDLKIKDVNDDGVINDQDRTYVGGRYPAYQYNLTLGFDWKGFDLSAQLYGSQGQKVYVSGWGIEPFRQGSVPTTDWRNRWTPTNPSTTMPKIYVADGYAPVQNYASTYFLKDASFTRLKNIQIGYTLPLQIVSKAAMKSLRVYIAADNVFTISKYPGLDPERITGGQYVTYPQLRTFTFGATVQF